MRGGPGSEGSIDPDETPEERERREKDRRAANNARERSETTVKTFPRSIPFFPSDYVSETSMMHLKNLVECVRYICETINLLLN